jgi:transcription elongation factor Elf1
MGCFDTVLVPCPRCGTREEAQTKSGPCNLATYNLDKAPTEVLANINRHGPFTCVNCGAVFKVNLVTTATPVLCTPD